MDKPTITEKKKLIFIMVTFSMFMFFLIGRIFYIQLYKAEELQALAYEQQTRDRLIAPMRGIIYDRNMNPIATNETVASVSVINAQIREHEKVAEILAEKLEMDYETVLKKVNKRVALERIKIKVDREIAEEIRKMNLAGVVIDEDIKRIYPYKSMASQVLGFVGKDNQGIIGLEAKYDEILKGSAGKILTETDARGLKLKDGEEKRIAPVNGDSLVLTLDTNLQQYAEQALDKALLAHNAERGVIVMMNPKNGEIYAMANKPDFDLNEPFEINNDELKAMWDTISLEEQNNHLNKMWRNFALNDTYEPGSTFKVITSAAGMQEGILNLETRFNCSGSKVVGGITIKCWRHPNSHGSQTFAEGIQNSCNPVFMDIGEDLGAETFYKYFKLFGFQEKTGIDLAGEASGIAHKLEKVGSVELATMSFGQSFQITPLQLLRGISATINGGYLVTPHLAKKVISSVDNSVSDFEFPISAQIIDTKISDDMKMVLESVVASGTGNKTYVAGYRIGGKTATSEKLPRRMGKYVASFLTFAPADDPKIVTIVLIDEPKGVYYGGQVAGPVMKDVLGNALPYLNMPMSYTEKDLKEDGVGIVTLPNFLGFDVKDAKKELENLKLKAEIIGEGEIVVNQFPLTGEDVNINSVIILYTD